MDGLVPIGHPVTEERRRLGVGPPLTFSSSLIPKGTPPKGRVTSANRRRLAGLVPVEVAEGVERRVVNRLDAGVERLKRRQLVGPEGVDQTAGVTQPRCHVLDGTAGSASVPISERVSRSSTGTGIRATLMSDLVRMAFDRARSNWLCKMRSRM